MSSKQSMGAARGERRVPAVARGARVRLATAAEGPKPDAFEAPVKWNMIYLIARVFYEMHGRTERALAPQNVTALQFTILSTLHRCEGLSSAELSRRFKVTPQTM